jgi:N-formylglutamate amidohydrolase
MSPAARRLVRGDSSNPLTIPPLVPTKRRHCNRALGILTTLLMELKSNPFMRLGPKEPECAVILSVPHAGRSFPKDIERLYRHPLHRLTSLEDRYADLLVGQAVAAGHSALSAQTPRAWIDLNRAESDLDPAMFDPFPALSAPISLKARGGLGLIPRRTPALGELWKRPIAADDLTQRIGEHHRPYHAALSALIGATYARFGAVILLDIHSMPPLPRQHEASPARIVVGDRFGRSASHWVSDRVHEIIRDHKIKFASNTPYAGGHILERYGQPHRDVHALQIEIDRSLYLDASMDAPGSGLATAQALIAEIARELMYDLERRALPIAAE